MSPADQQRAYDAAIAMVAIMSPNVRGAPEFLRQQLQRLKAQAALPVVFRHLGTDDAGQDCYEIGRDGATRFVRSRCRGVWAVHRLLACRHELAELNVGDLADPEAREPEASARRAIRHTAALKFREWGVPELEAATLACKVSGGIVFLELPANAPQFDTRASS